MKRREGTGLALLGVATAEVSGRTKGLGLLGIAGAVGAACLALPAGATGLLINGDSSGRCIRINEPSSYYVTGGTTELYVRENLLFGATEGCDSADKNTQKDRALFYRNTTDRGANSLSLGGELFVNGSATLNRTTLNGDTAVNGPINLNSNVIRTGTGGFILGDSSSTVGHVQDIAIGRATANASALDRDGLSGAALAIGIDAAATAPSTVSIGFAATASGSRAAAVGPAARAAGYSSAAFGRFAQALGENAVALGRNTVTATNAEGAVAIGYGARAEDANSVALGALSRTSPHRAVSPSTLNGTTYRFLPQGLPALNTNGVVSVGSAAQSRQIINVAPGVVDATSYDAVNGSQLFAAYTEINKLGAKDVELETRLNNLPKGGSAESVRAAMGAGTTVSPTGELVLPQLKLDSLGAQPNGQPAVQPTTVLGAIGALDGELAKTNESLGVLLDNALLYNPETKTYDARSADQATTKIANVAAGEAEADAVNVSQLNAVSSVANAAQSSATAAQTSAAAAKAAADAAQGTANTASTAAAAAKTSARNVEPGRRPRADTGQQLHRQPHQTAATRRQCGHRIGDGRRCAADFVVTRKVDDCRGHVVLRGRDGHCRGLFGALERRRMVLSRHRYHDDTRQRRRRGRGGLRVVAGTGVAGVLATSVYQVLSSTSSRCRR